MASSTATASTSTPRQHHHRLSSGSSVTASQRAHPYRSAQRSHRSSESLEETELGSEIMGQVSHDLDVRSPRTRRKAKPVFASMSVSDINNNLGLGCSGGNEVDSFADPSVRITTTSAGKATFSFAPEEALGTSGSSLLPAFEDPTPFRPMRRVGSSSSSFSPDTPRSTTSSNRLLFSGGESVIDLSGPDTPTASPSPSPTKSTTFISPEYLTSRFKRQRSSSSSLFDTLRTSSTSQSKAQRISPAPRLPACLLPEPTLGSPVNSPPSSPIKYGPSPVKNSRGVRSLSCLRERQRERRHTFRRAVSALDYTRSAFATDIQDLHDAEEDEDLLEEGPSGTTSMTVDAEEEDDDGTNDLIQSRLAETLASSVASPRTPHNDNLRRSALFGCSTDDAAKVMPARRHAFIDVNSPNDSPIAMFLLAGFSMPSELEMDEGFFRGPMAEDDPLLRIARKSEAHNASVNANVNESEDDDENDENDDVHMQRPSPVKSHRPATVTVTSHRPVRPLVAQRSTSNLRHFSHIMLPPDSPEMEFTRLRQPAPVPTPVPAPVAVVESDSVKENLPVPVQQPESPSKPKPEEDDKTARPALRRDPSSNEEERGRLRSQSIVMTDNDRAGAPGCESPSVLHDITHLMI